VEGSPNISVGSIACADVCEQPEYEPLTAGAEVPLMGAICIALLVIGCLF
jgi:hypothetical protein